MKNFRVYASNWYAVTLRKSYVDWQNILMWIFLSIAGVLRITLPYQVLRYFFFCVKMLLFLW